MIRTSILWLLAVLLEMLLIALFVSASWVNAQIKEERSAIFSWLGKETTTNIIESTNNSYRYFFQATGLVEGSYEIFIPNKEQIQASAGMETLGKPVFVWFKERLDAFWITIYHSFQRLFTLLEWLPYMLPLLLPAVIDGAMQREIKKVTYGYASPVRYHTAFHLLLALIFLPFIYMFFPIAVTPIIIPIWALLLAIVLLVLSANIQKKI